MGLLLDYCLAHQDALRKSIDRLVQLESPSTDKAAVDRCGAVLAAMLTEAGATVTRFPQTQRGDHLRAEFPGGSRRILLLGHFDTVWDVGQIQRMPLREEDGRLYGPGVYDMKASIALSILAMRAVRGGLHAGSEVPTVVKLWTTDEEVGSDTSRGYIEAEARTSDAVLVLEPSLPARASAPSMSWLTRSSRSRSSAIWSAASASTSAWCREGHAATWWRNTLVRWSTPVSRR